METIDKVKQMVIDGVLSQEEAEKYFPELAESEDEKIRKGLIEACKQSLIVGGFHKDKVISWLEKQGEHTNFRNKIQISDKVTRNEDGILVNLSQLNRVAKKDEKQGEQKPKVTSKFKVGDTIWKKDDHSNKITISSIDEYFYYANSYNIIINIADKEWELVEQKPTEWSEEDEKMLNGIISDVSYRYKNILSQQQIDWLKSLRPQKQWKPSEEHLQGMRRAICKADKGSDAEHYLKDLYEQLKAL